MKEKPIVLIAEDDDSMRFLLEEVLSRNDYETISVDNGQSALDVFRQKPFDLVLLDVKMPKMNGLDVLDKIKHFDEEATVIVLTAFATIKTAVEAMKRGAYDYITKPFEIEELMLVVNKALEKRDLILENRLLKKKLHEYGPGEYHTEVSLAMKGIFERLERVAPTDYTVLLEGESGTGKSLLAKRIHEMSDRKKGPFIRVNCAALPPNLVESELFGYEKGAFTGANRQKPGKVELANGGTLFLDEISTLDLSAQASLLHMLQDQEFERVGGTHTVKVEVRTIAASNQILREMVRNRTFREDLYFRLNVFNIIIPSLRERKEDILPLACHIIDKLKGDREVRLTVNTANKLKEYDWPGNIRELENVIKHALILLGCEEEIDVYHLPAELCTQFDTIKQDGLGLKEMLMKTERQIIEHVLIENEMDIEKSAHDLKLAKRSLYYRMSKLNMNGNAYRQLS